MFQRNKEADYGSTHQETSELMGMADKSAAYGGRRSKCHWVWLVFLALIPVVVGLIIGFTVNTGKYRTGELIQPSWSPPSWLFGPVWTVLYILIGISSALVWHYGEGINKDTANPLLLYVMQLVANFAWTPVFFAGGYLAGALIIIAAMWSLIVATIMTFFRISKIAAILLIPYLLWVSFATALNYAQVCLNGCVSVDSGNATTTMTTLINYTATTTV